ncbi:thiol reductant ABC exporter subunit CydC [Halomonas sp. Bachu 37]|uniref:thiol reductant ABC exporter subunit CydC n=1 Tax=Halomonas kashgarensis TaxID=3084920 RepID=UPI003217FA09
MAKGESCPAFWHTLQPWWTLIARRRKRLWLGSLLIGVTLVSAIGLLALSGWFITSAALTGLVIAGGGVAFLDVYVPGGGIRFFALSRTVARYIERLYNHDTVLRLLSDLRGHVFSLLARQDRLIMAQRRSSDWLSRLTADIDALDSLYLRLVAPPVVALAGIIGLALFVGFWVPRAGLLLGVILTGAWLWLVIGQARWGMRASRAQGVRLESLRGRLLEQLQGMAELEVYGSLARHRSQVDLIEHEMQYEQRRLGTIAATGNALVAWASGLALIAVLWLAALAWQADAISGPVMVMLVLAVLALNEALSAIPAAFTRFGNTLAAAERLNALARGQDNRRSSRSTFLPESFDVQLEDVSLSYPDALTPAISKFSLELKLGERVALCGASGTGKSSVAALLSRQLLPDEGRILFAGIDINEVDESDFRQKVGYLTQYTELFDATLAENLRIGCSNASDMRLWQVLESVELRDWASALPQGLATPLREAGQDISGGQGRRIALARLLLRDPSLVILDEPFAGLDNETATTVARYLDKWLVGRSVLYLVHEISGNVRLSQVSRCVWMETHEASNR